MPAFLLAAILAAAGPPAAPARFDAIAFFTGRTEGEGQLSIALHHAARVRVHGHGHVERDGTLVLDQTVERAGHATTTRTWRIRAVAPGRYAGTLTDARGPIAGESSGDRLHLAYRGAGGVRIEQWLTLDPDGRGAQNRLTARKFGVVVARLDETIRRVD